jgi:GAF domain-containing protein
MEMETQTVNNPAENQIWRYSQSRVMDTLGRISLALNATRDLSRVLDLICRESSRLFDVGSAFIWLVEGDYLVGFAGYGYRRDDFIGLRVSLIDSVILGPRVIREKRPMFVNNAPRSEGVDPALISIFDTKSILGTPLIADNKAIGALMLLDNESLHRFGEEDVELAGLLGSHAAIAITNARLYEEITARVKESNQRSEELEALREASFHLTANLELKPLLEAILEQAMKLIDATNVHIFLYSNNNLSFGAARWADGREETPYRTVRPTGLTATVVKKGEAIIIPNVNESPLYQNWQWGGGIAGFPIKIGAEIVGVMNVATRIPHFFDENELRVLKLFADEAAIAIKNAQLFEATRRQLEELAVLHAIAVAGVKAIDEDSLIEETTRIIGETFYPHNFGVLLLDESGEFLAVHPSYRVDRIIFPKIKVTEGIVGRVAATGRPIRENDVRQSKYYLMRDDQTRSELCVPLKVGDRTMGVINAESDQFGGFTASDERLLTTLAGQLAIALERLRTENVERLQRRRLLIISELAREMTGSLKVRELCTVVAERICREFGYFNVSIFLVDTNTRETVLQHNAGAYGPLLAMGEYRQKFGVGLIGLAAETGQPQVYNDTSNAPGFFYLEGMAILSEAALPLKVGDRVIGVLNIDSSEPDSFNSGDIAALMAITDQLSITIEKARLFEEATRRSEDLQSAQDILHALNAFPNVVDAFPNLSKGLKALTGCDRISIALLEENDTWFSIYALDQPRSELKQGARMPVSMTCCAENVLAGRPHLTPKLEDEITFPAEMALYQAGHRSRINIPLFVAERVIGALNLVWPYEMGYASSQLPLLSQMAQAIALAVEKTRLFTEVKQRALETAELHEQLQKHAAELEARVSERTKELAEANEQLKELDRLKSKFVSDVSHELRTPVANLWLYLDLMERGRVEKRDHYLDVLKQETRRLEQLIENTLNLSRLEMTDSQTNFEAVDLNKLVDQIIVAYQPRADLDNLAFNFTAGEKLPPVHGAKNQLAQVINNILSNAFNYTVEGFVLVKTYADNDRNQAVLEVIDSGIGIDPEDLPHLFDRFYRGQHTGQSDIPGTGLGLAIAKEIVDLHQGTIEVDTNQEGGKTVFRVRLPFSRPLLEIPPGKAPQGQQE